MVYSSAKKPMHSPFPIKDIPLVLIDLDLRNSRFPRDAQSQDDAMKLMMNTAGDECLDMLKDLTRSGSMNSSDVPIVIARDKRYMVMEGNRRLTCLRLWSNPTLLRQDESLNRRYYSRVERLVEDSAYFPSPVLRAAVAPSEEDADIWIERKHAGGAGGAGTVEWGAAMKDRRRARNDPTKTSRAMAFVELVSGEYVEEPDVLTALETVRNARYSFIQRFVDRRVVRDMIGLEFSKGEMSFRYGAGPSLPIIRQMLTDFANPKAESGKTWARELDTVDDFRDYLNKYSHLLPGGDGTGASVDNDNDRERSTPTRPDGGHSDVARGGSTDSEGEGIVGQSRREGAEETDDLRPPRPTAGRDYIFRKLVLDKFTPRIQEMVRQTSLLSVRRQNETVSVMLRVILDLAAYQFLKSYGKEVPRNLDARIKEAIKIIDPQAPGALGQAEDTSQLRKAFHATTADAIRLVQYAVHDIHNGKTPMEVITLADRYTPVLVEMNVHMGKVAVQ